METTCFFSDLLSEEPVAGFAPDLGRGSKRGRELAPPGTLKVLQTEHPPSP